MNDLTRRIAALSAEKRALLEARLGGRDAEGSVSRRGPLSEGPPPLSFAQEEIWSRARIDPESRFFVTATPVSLPPSTDLSALRRALSEVIERHEALRTEIGVEQGQPVQILGAVPPDPLTVIGADDPAAEATADEAARAVAALRPPLFRALALVSADGEIQLTLLSHAIVCDGASLAVVESQLRLVCDALGRGIPPALPAAPVRPADYARGQRQRPLGRGVERWIDRWRSLDRPSLLALHTDRARPAKRLPDVARHRWTIEGDRVQRARAATAPAGAKDSSLWIAALATVLGRFARQDVVVLGVQSPNRARPERRGFVGVVANVLPVPVELDGGIGGRALVANADAELTSAIACEDLPYEKLLQELRIEGPDRHNPLFQVVLAVRSEMECPSAAAGGPGGWSFVGGSPLFDLALLVDDAAPSPALELRYNARLFEAGAVQSMARALDAVVEALAERPDDPVTSLPLLPAADGAVEDAPLPAAPAFADTIHGLFERRAELDPQRIALAGEQVVSYGELNGRANRLARALLARGLRRGDAVGVCMSRSVDLVVSFLAILKAGAVYVPLDPQYPPERLDFMARDAGTALILERGDGIGSAPWGCDTVDVTRLDVSAERASNLDGGVGGADAAYLIYTSGSTGQPKGVLVQHVGVCHVADEQLRHFGLADDERILQFASPSFDASIFELVMAPRCGGTLHLAPAEELLPGPPLLALLKARRITVLTIPPTVLSALAPIDLPHLRVVIAAGEACGAELVSRWAPRCRFFNAYGPTEASIWATVAECVPDETAPSIGRPLAHVSAHVVDERLRPLPAGAPGELLLGGCGVALGYLNRPELTAERFLNAPAGALPAGRWYRTGDVVRRDSAGRLWYLGRTDRQVKVRGFRIEPGEIEVCLLEVAGVRQAAVEIESGSLVAYYVADKEPADPPDFHDVLSRRLPRHMIPATFVALHAMPVGPNGKLDRARLRLQTRRRAPGLRPPRSGAERTLAEIWKAVLRLDDVGVDDNFFDLGGHSLLAANVMSRACAALDREVPLRTLFRLPTIGQLAEAFDGAVPASAEAAP